MKKITLIIFAIVLSAFLPFCSDSTDNSAKIDSYLILFRDESGNSICQRSDYQSDGICYVSNNQFTLEDADSKLTGQAIPDTVFQGNFVI